MLTKRSQLLHDMVWEAAARVGRSPPKIADAIVERLWPMTHSASIIEGADKCLRDGLVTEVSRIVRAPSDDARQMDWSEVHEDFRALARELKSGAYTVPSLGEALSIAALISDPPLLKEAAGFMQTKGDECHAEARRLFALYEAVTDGA